MATNIYQFNGTLLATVADGTLNTSAAPIAFPGKGYSNYGAPVMQDVLWVMQNFAGAITPTPTLQGMCWYDTSTNSLKLYTGTTWTGMYKQNQSLIPDTTATYDIGSSTYKFNNIWGTDLHAATGNITAITSTTVTATSYLGDNTLYRTGQTNLPSATNTYNLGSATYKYANVYATTFNGVATSAQYADVAERYEADALLEVGDVVVIGGTKEITKSVADADVNVFGVVSDKPALKMNDKAGNDKTHPLVALLGRTPCKVAGPIGKGQRLVASNIPGVARAAHGDETTLSILGRSLEAKTTDGIELVEIVIGRS